MQAQTYVDLDLSFMNEALGKSCCSQSPVLAVLASLMAKYSEIPFKNKDVVWPSCVYIYIYIIWLFNIAMENHHFSKVNHL